METSSTLFISYAHKDSNQVKPFISKLIDEGFDVWFDKGIEPGIEWDERIASSINDSVLFIALLSPNYIQSNNCKDELNYARDIDKRMLLISLEETELSPGMKMRLGRSRIIKKHEYSDSDAFYADLFQSDELTELTQDAATDDSADADKTPNDIQEPIPKKKYNRFLPPGFRHMEVRSIIFSLMLYSVVGILFFERRNTMGKTVLLWAFFWIAAFFIAGNYLGCLNLPFVEKIKSKLVKFLLKAVLAAVYIFVLFIIVVLFAQLIMPTN